MSDDHRANANNFVISDGYPLRKHSFDNGVCTNSYIGANLHATPTMQPDAQGRLTWCEAADNGKESIFYTYESRLRREIDYFVYTLCLHCFPSRVSNFSAQLLPPLQLLRRVHELTIYAYAVNHYPFVAAS